MEVQCKLRSRTLKQCYQRCRHEDQIWMLAYEQVCPQIRRPLPIGRADAKPAKTRHIAARRA